MTPARLFPGLFQAVAEARLFADSKHFADAIPRRDPEAIVADYRSRAPLTPEALRDFVEANFALPERIESAPVASALPLRAAIAARWDALTRPPAPAAGSALAIGLPHVVPGGRFRELYCWDSYFTLLGLARDRPVLARNMVDIFVDLIERHGHIPNGARTFYVGRSQPPLFALMMDLVPSHDPARALDAALVEHRFWTSPPHIFEGAEFRHLARYGDLNGGPREESWREDVSTADAAAIQLGRRSDEVWRELRAGAESGWDFSSRWLGDPRDLGTIGVTGLAPVDLNALLFAAERSLAARCRAAGRAGEATALDALADARRAAVDRCCWQEELGWYGDAIPGHGTTGRLSAATLFPLFAGMATQAQADRVAAITERLLLAPGGLRTTLVRSGQQWDAPNGWAPLQWAAIEGLRRYGHDSLGEQIADAWLATVDGHYRRTGQILEKYDVETGAGGSGGEYAVQIGFGWTNGVCAALLDERD